MAAPLQDNEKDALIARLQNENRSLIQEQSMLGLNYNHNKEDGIDARHLANNDIPIFTRVPELSTIKTDEDVDHLLIEGDNLPALVALLPTYRGKVNVIYIDPPYNTGNQDFVYNDRYVDCEDGFRHSKWLSFMKPRLQLAHEMLSDDGVIFVSIDDHEQAYLKVMMDGIFGESNFVEEFLWIKNSGNNNSILTSTKHETILTYAKDISRLSKKYFSYKKSGYSEVAELMHRCKEYGVSVNEAQENLRMLYKKNKHRFSKGLLQYKYIDDDYKVFRVADLGNPSNSALKNADYTYELIDPRTHKQLTMPKRGWLYKKNAMMKKLNNNEIYTDSEVPGIKRYLDTVETQNVSSIIEDYSNGSDSLNDIFGNIVFDHPKPVSLIKRLLTMHPDKNALILDFFAGSGTTGQAVAELNKEDGGNRKCILITNNFEQDGAPNGIARDITSVRMKRVLTGREWADGKEHEPLPGNLIYYRLDWQPMSTSLTNLPGMLPLSTFLGSLSINQHAHRLMNVPVSMPTLSRLVHDGHAALLTDKNNKHMVLALDATTSDDFDALDTVKAELEGANLLEGLDVAMESGFDVDTYMDSGVFDHELTFPVPDIIQMQATVKMLKKDGVI